MRYIIGLAKENDKQCYQDKLEVDTQAEAKEKAEEISAKYSRNAIVYDKIEQLIIYEVKGTGQPMVVAKIGPASVEEVVAKIGPDIPVKRGRGRPRKYPIPDVPAVKRGRGRPRKNP